MSKIKKYQIAFDLDVNYDMIGISSHHQGYRLAWNMNKFLELNLSLSLEPFVITVIKKGNYEHQEFSMFEYDDESNKVKYYLIRNKENGKFLVPEQPNIDYFLFIVETGMVDVKTLCDNLKSIPVVLAVFHMDPLGISSTENIVF